MNAPRDKSVSGINHHRQRTLIRIGLFTTVIALGLNLGPVWACLLDPQVPPTAVPQATAPVDSSSTGKPTKAGAKFVVPFEMLPTNHMLVDARINDKGPYRLIFDLGAPITLLGNRASEAAGVVKADAPRSFLFSMRGPAEVAKLQAGELTAAKLPVIVFDHPVLTALEDMTDRKIDGIMGFTFFARYKTTIDYQAHQMTFEPVEFKVRDLLKDLPDRLMGPKVARRRVLAPLGVWGLRLGEPIGSLDAPGVTIAAVDDGSPAHRAGLRPGDILLSADGRWTTSIVDVFHAAADVKPGQRAAIEILRDGKQQTLSITPADGA